MGASLSNNSDSDGATPISDINVTPFVDVVLVLLVIFIITAPTIMKDRLNITLPKASQSDSKGPVSLGIAITKQGQVLLNGMPLSLVDLEREVAKELRTNPDIQGVISADQDSRHGDLVTVIDAVKRVGLNKFAIQIQKQNNK